MFAAAPLANGHRRIDTEQIVCGSKLLGELRDLLRRKHSGLRLMEGLRLRIQDMEFNRSQIIVRDGKGAKDRVTLLPQALA